MSGRPMTIEEILERRVEVDDNGCWIWTGKITWAGYGSFRGRQAHRVVYELIVGPIPAGLDLDHVRARGCRSRACVNPAHLEPVTRAVNLRRSPLVGGGHWRKQTHCKKGHEFTPANTYVRTDRPRRRQCRICMNEASRRFHARKGAAA